MPAYPAIATAAAPGAEAHAGDKRKAPLGDAISGDATKPPVKKKPMPGGGIDTYFTKRVDKTGAEANPIELDEI